MEIVRLPMFRIASAFRLFLLSAVFASFLCSSASAAEKVWRAIYVEGGPFINYQHTLAHTARGLEKLGLVSNAQVSIPHGN